MTTPEAQAVNEALRRLQQGDRSAAPAVFAALWPVVSAFCRKALGDGGQDAAQETLMKVFAQAHRFRPDGNAVAWALEVAGWECRTELKRRARGRTTGLSGAEAVADGGDAAAALEGQQLAAAVRASVAHLSPADQAVVTSILDETFAPGAGAAARKRKERALTRLKQAWRSLYGIE